MYLSCSQQNAQSMENTLLSTMLHPFSAVSKLFQPRRWILITSQNYSQYVMLLEIA